MTFSLSPGQAHDAPEGRRLLNSLGQTSRPVHLLMDRAYEGNETRQLALDLGFIPVVPPMKTRIEPWEYDREMYKRRNEVERFFRRLKGYRRIFSRFEKLDLMFLGFISFVLVADGLRMCYQALVHLFAISVERHHELPQAILPYLQSHLSLRLPDRGSKCSQPIHALTRKPDNPRPFVDMIDHPLD